MTLDANIRIILAFILRNLLAHGNELYWEAMLAVINIISFMLTF
jgi:hypothetical protein